MEELQCKKTLRKVYWSHLTFLIKKWTPLLTQRVDLVRRHRYSIKQFNEHTALFKEVDQEIANTITDEDKLKAEIIESSATQEAIFA